MRRVGIARGPVGLRGSNVGRLRLHRGCDNHLRAIRAVAAIVDRLKGALRNTCLSNKLVVGADGSVGCSLLVTLPGAGSCTAPTCPAAMGLSVPPTDVLAKYCAAQEASYMGQKGVPGDPEVQSVCELTQLVKGRAAASDFDANGSCGESPEKGWCYVEGAGANGCAQTLVFGLGSLPVGSLTSLLCLP